MKLSKKEILAKVKKIIKNNYTPNCGNEEYKFRMERQEFPEILEEVI